MTEASTSALRVKLIKDRLQGSLQPSDLVIIDDSHKHAGHQGAQESGGGHFNIRVVSQHFQNKSAVERHRMIYMALNDVIGTDIHALSINAQTPQEASDARV